MGDNLSFNFLMAGGGASEDGVDSVVAMSPVVAVGDDLLMLILGTGFFSSIVFGSALGGGFRGGFLDCLEARKFAIFFV